MTLIDQSIEAAGLRTIAEKRARGESLSTDEMARVGAADLLVLGALADRVRRADTGDEVRVFVSSKSVSRPELLLVESRGDRGSPLFRRIALARLSAAKGARVCLDFGEVGLEIAQVALSFGVSDLTGPLASKRGLPLAEDASKTLARKSELTGYITRAKRTAVFVDESLRRTREAQMSTFQLPFPEELRAIADKVVCKERLTEQDALTLFEHPDFMAVGQLAHLDRERRHQDRAYFNENMRIEVTNVCVASCLFCSFAKLEEGSPGAHTMKLEEAWRELEVRMDAPPAEIHIVNGLHPGLPFSYYEELLRGFKTIKSDIHLKCFTAVEIHFFAQHYGMPHREVLEKLRAAGLDSLPGGGAEIFHPDVRSRISHDKATADEYLAVHREAHSMGIRTNTTMLYGHIETFEHRIDHMRRLRELQDETHGFQAFIPRSQSAGSIWITSITSSLIGYRPRPRSRSSRCASVRTTSTGRSSTRRSTRPQAARARKA
jgi:2-iminoacetate synthase ThiH